MSSGRSIHCGLLPLIALHSIKTAKRDARHFDQTARWENILGIAVLWDDSTNKVFYKAFNKSIPI